MSGCMEVHAVRICMHNDWILIRSCIHESETDWMHARGQPATARAWPAASGQLAGWRVHPWGTQYRHDMPPIAATEERC